MSKSIKKLQAQEENRQYIFFSSIHEKYMNIDNLLGQRENINFQRSNIIFSDYSTIKLEVNIKIRKK